MYVHVSLLRDTGNTPVLTYAVPAGREESLRVGSLVEVPFRARREEGIVRSIFSETPAFSTKEIGYISSSPLLSPEELDFIELFAQKNLTSFSRAVRLFLPQKILQTKGQIPQKKGFLRTTLPEDAVKGSRQKEVLALFSAPGEVIHTSVFTEKHIPKTILKKLEEKGYIVSVSEDMYPPLPECDETEKEERHCEIFCGSAHSDRNALVLEKIKNTLGKGKQVLFLIPEHFSLFQRSEVFERILGEENVSCISGKISASARQEVWWKAKRKTPHFFLGTRTALFFPYAKLGLIVVEDVQDSSYKSDAMPRYHARETAEAMAEKKGADLLFSTACPDAETLGGRCMPLTKEQTTLPFSFHVFSDTLPKGEIYDMREEIAGGNTLSLSRPLQKAIAETLTEKKQVLLFINRRGLFRAMFCNGCGYIPKCPICRTSLPLHEKDAKTSFFCHWCGHHEHLQEVCPKCGKKEFKEVGDGTQRIERDLKKLFPSAKLLRADKDTITGKSDDHLLFQKFANGEGDILLGTQMITKGFQFPHCALVVSISPEIDLYSPSFRGEEKMLQNLINLRDRLGKTGDRRRFCIQTSIPSHPAIIAAAQGKPLPFIFSEGEERKTLRLPPFSQILRFTFVETTAEKVKKKIELAKKHLEKALLSEKVFISTPPLPYKRGEFFMSLLVTLEPGEHFPPSAIPPGARTDPYGD